MGYGHDYLFRIPANTPPLVFADLSAWMGVRWSRKIGTTVTVTYWPATSDIEPEINSGRFEIRLYDTVIAYVYPDHVVFPGPDDPHLATSEWIARIVRDNAIGNGVFRVRRHKADGPGPLVPRGRAGLLVINGSRDKPVFGRTYPVDPAEITQLRTDRERRRIEFAAERERYAAESARREALKTWAGPEGTFHAGDDYSHGDGCYFRVVDGTFRDNGTGIIGAYFNTVGYVYDTRPGAGASPEPDPDGKAVFAAFAGADRSRERGGLGMFAVLADAVAAVARHEFSETASKG